EEEENKAAREQTRGQLEKLLGKVGPVANVSFSVSQKHSDKYVGLLKTGLVNAEGMEIFIDVTPKETIEFRVYPHYKKAYLNLDKVSDRSALMRMLLELNSRTFLYWGADEAGDVFTGYTFTLESGFPEEAITVVLRSIVNSDKFVGEMRPILDAPTEPVVKPAAKPATKKKAPSRPRGI
ncbi:MAG TPA: hypothetical protein VGC61_08030, partial [Pyrinomonadaceae bacterium]